MGGIQWGALLFYNFSLSPLSVTTNVIVLCEYLSQEFPLLKVIVLYCNSQKCTKSQFKLPTKMTVPDAVVKGAVIDHVVDTLPLAGGQVLHIQLRLGDSRQCCHVFRRPTIFIVRLHPVARQRLAVHLGCLLIGQL